MLIAAGTSVHIGRSVAEGKYASQSLPFSDPSTGVVASSQALSRRIIKHLVYMTFL